MAQELTPPAIKDGWFAEISDTMWPGLAMLLKVEKVLYSQRSKYQDVLVFKSTNWGNVLVLDNCIQATERDEYSYQEMITHLAMNSHPNPKKALVIGGGDGGVLREILKHELIEEAWLCDIDEDVIKVSKQFLADYQNTFDVIITDSSDPEGPAESLFQKPYFELLKGALTEKGVITTQAESIWLHMDIISKLKQDCRQIFPVAEYAYTSIPTYPSGTIGFMVCSKDEKAQVKTPLRRFSEEFEDTNLRYYNSQVHEASFVLPQWANKILNKQD